MESTERLDKHDGHLELPVTQWLEMDLDRGTIIAAQRENISMKWKVPY